MTGSTEVMTGETLGASMSGTAIAQLQAQASQPIEELRDTFWLVKEKQGKVLAQFFKLYYEDKEYSYPAEDDLVDTEGNLIYERGDSIPDTFSSSDYADADISVVVEAMSGTRSSSAGDINLLDNLYSKGQISTKTYVESYPDDAISNKTELLNRINEDEQGKVAQLQAQVQQLNNELEQSAELIKKFKDTVENTLSIVQENVRLKAELGNLYSESKAKIDEANRQINLGNQKIAETTEDATYFANAIANGYGSK